MNNDKTAHDGGPDTGRVIGGLIVITVGIALLLDRLAVADFQITGHLWPFVVLIIGVARLTAPVDIRHGRRARWGGGWLLIVGIWGLISEFHVFGMDYSQSWPLLIIGAGVMLVLRPPVDERRGPDRKTEDG